MHLKRGSKSCSIDELESRCLLNGGTLDAGFGVNGFGTATKSGGFIFRATDVASLPNGKLAVAGVARNKSGVDFPAIARYTATGALDTTFGPDHSGLAISQFICISDVSIAVQSDGKIVVASTYGGHFTDGSPNVEAMLLRFNTDGSPDTLFHSPFSFITAYDFGGRHYTTANDVAIQHDGKIVFTGLTDASDADDCYVARINSDGTLDKSFDGGANVINVNSYAAGNAITIDYSANASMNSNYGKIVIAGVTDTNSAAEFLVARLTTSGHLDSSFNHNGLLASKFLSEDNSSVANAVVMEPNDEIVLAGPVGSDADNKDFGIVRLHANGSGDLSFGPSNGQIAVDFGADDSAQSIILNKTGELLVGGFSDLGRAMVLLTAKGIVDKAFGPSGNGKVVTNLSGSQLSASGLALTLNGKFFAAGGTNMNVGRYSDRAPSTISITATDPNASEQDQDPAVFTVSRPEVLNTPTRVLFQVSGTATSPFTLIKKFSDYTGITAPPPPGIGQPLFPPNTAYVDIPAGQKSVTFSITPIDDTRPEPAETVIFTLESRPEYDIAPGHGIAQATIHDNDTPAGTGATLGDIADAYVRDGANAGANFGKATDLEVKKAGSGFNRVSYIKFDLSSVSTINSVTLDLFGKISDTQNANITTSIFSVADTSWSETGINFNNAPAASATALAGVTVTGTTLQMVHADVTAYVKAQFAAGHKVISFALKDSASSNSFVQFNSREAGAQTPALVVT